MSLHDAVVLALERGTSSLEVLFRAGDTASGYFDARLWYGDVALSRGDEQFLNNAMSRHDTELLYDEFDSTDGNRWVHRFLFWPYHQVSIHFGSLKLDVTPVHGRFEEADGSHRRGE